MKISKATIDRLTPPGKDKGYALHWDDNLHGFGVRITASGAISYVAQGRVNGKAQRVTLGKSTVLTPTEARKKAKRRIGQMADGVDSRTEKLVTEAATKTLRNVADDYLANKKTGKQGLPLKQRTKDDIEYHVAGTFSDWQRKPIANITRDMVRKRYREKSAVSIAQANQAMRILSALINYAIATLRKPDGSKIIADNPVDVLRESSTLSGVKPKTTAIPPGKRGEWWAEVQRRRNDPGMATASKTAIDLIAFIALTGLRLTEAKTLKWSQVDLHDRSFNLLDTKNRRDVTFPLSDQAHDILAERFTEGAEYVFPGRVDGHLDNANKQFKAINEAVDVHISAHPLRRTFIQIGMKELSLDLWRVKGLSNHKLGGDVTLNDYGDLTDVRFLRDEAQEIADYYDTKRQEFETGNVVSIEARRA